VLEQAGEVALVISAITVWPGLAIPVKRWHDRDRSLRWRLTLLIPFLGISFLFWMVIIGVWFLKGTDGANRFGQDPLLPEAALAAYCHSKRNRLPGTNLLCNRLAVALMCVISVMHD
jgi:hypothetical protein